MAAKEPLWVSYNHLELSLAQWNRTYRLIGFGSPEKGCFCVGVTDFPFREKEAKKILSILKSRDVSQCVCATAVTSIPYSVVGNKAFNKQGAVTMMFPDTNSFHNVSEYLQQIIAMGHHQFRHVSILPQSLNYLSSR